MRVIPLICDDAGAPESVFKSQKSQFALCDSSNRLALLYALYSFLSIQKKVMRQTTQIIELKCQHTKSKTESSFISKQPCTNHKNLIDKPQNIVNS